MTRIDRIKQQAAGRWRAILVAAGIPEDRLDGHGHPCPRCHGVDRFASFPDVDERGAVHCRNCHTKGQGGDGIETVKWIRGWTTGEAVKWLEGYLGLSNGEADKGKRRIVATYDYRDEVSELLLQVVRYDNKTFSQRRPKPGGGWERSVKGVRPVPYRLPELLAEPKRAVVVVEGEKDADNLARIGILATCNAGGAGKWTAEHAEFLAGRTVVVLPDNDQRGREHAQQVARSLRGVAKAIKLVELPGLLPKGDVSDWVAAGRTKEEMVALVKAAPLWTPAAAPPAQPAKKLGPPPWRPFPADVLPEPVRGYVRAGSQAMKCDEAYIALPMLAGLASAIGATRRITLKAGSPGWHEPSVVWAGVVADSGTMKSPAQNLALRPLRRAQEWQLEQLPDLAAQYERDKALYEADMSAWKKKGRARGEPPPEKPEEPRVERYVVNDITIEALAEILSDNPRGVLVACDELASWLGSFDQYRPGRGADVAKWLSIHRAEGLIVDRKSGAKKTIFVKSAAVSVAGSIQPGALRRALGLEYFENGLAARLLLASPPRIAKRWSEAAIDSDTYKAVELVYARLLAIKFGVDENDSPAPVDVPLSHEAKAVWVDFYNQHASVMESATGRLASAYAKLEAYAARLALITNMVKAVTSDAWPICNEMIDVESMMAGIALARWFVHETERVYRILEETESEAEDRQFVEWITRRGGEVTVRDLTRGPRKYRDTEVAEAALQGLVDAELGTWCYDDHDGGRGRPTRVFRLRPPGDANAVFATATGGDGDTNSRTPEKDAFSSPSPVAPQEEHGLPLPQGHTNREQRKT